MSMTSLKGKVGVVTRGGQGIGMGIVKRLLEEGMSVVIAEIDEEAGQMNPDLSTWAPSSLLELT